MAIEHMWVSMNHWDGCQPLKAGTHCPPSAKHCNTLQSRPHQGNCLDGSITDKIMYCWLCTTHPYTDTIFLMTKHDQKCMHNALTARLTVCMYDLAVCEDDAARDDVSTSPW
jgi:hypothetical protein